MHLKTDISNNNSNSIIFLSPINYKAKKNYNIKNKSLNFSILSYKNAKNPTSPCSP